MTKVTVIKFKSGGKLYYFAPKPGDFRFEMRSIGKIPLLGHTSVNRYSVKNTLEIAELEYRKI